MTLPVTAFTAAICALLLIFLSFQVVKQRIRTESMFGASDDEKMKMVRGCHSNLAEHAPLAIIMVGVLELANAHHMALIIIAGLFLVARILHVYGMHIHQAGKTPRIRQVAVMSTWLTMTALALWILYICATVNLL